jgi:membrane dipeptidase
VAARIAIGSFALLGLAALQSGCGSDVPAPAPVGRALTLDTHVDIPLDFATPAVDPLTADLQANLEKMTRGGLDAAFFIVYVDQTARTDEGYARAQTEALTKFAAIHRMAEELYPDRIEIAYTAADVPRIAQAGKRVAAIGVENGFALGRGLDMLDRYHELGARYFGLVHNGDNDLARSAQPNLALGDAAESTAGVSELGAEAIARLNRLGVMVDVSHGSKQTALDAMRLSAAPVIASHSGIAAVTAHPRNLDDETLRALRDDGGVVQIVAFSAYLKTQPAARADAQRATVADLVDHVDYAVSLIGIDHVGLSSDFGGGGGITGWDDASETANVTAELAARGYGEADIAKIWSGNLLRVWRAAEETAARLGARP